MSRRTGAPPRGAADVTPETLNVLVLPTLSTVTDDQSRGAACVWCTGPLTTDMAVDLGEQTSDSDGTALPVHWMPRACPTCTVERAQRARFAHGPTCEQCVDEAAHCEVGEGLLDLLRRYST